VSVFGSIQPCDIVQIWINLGLLVSAIIAVPLVLYQLRVQRIRERNWKTLEACRLYDTDPTLDKATFLLNEAMGPEDDFTKLTLKDHEHATVTMLNYLDGIAISVEQGIYYEAIVRDHFEFIIPKAVRGLILGKPDPKNPSYFKPAKFHDVKYYASLVRLHHQWHPEDKDDEIPKRQSVRMGP
jgi:hypothetical protein